MNALLNNPDNIETFDTLAQNVHFVFMPMCNPSGFVDNSYENRAGMNLNRDFGPHGNFEHPESKYEIGRASCRKEVKNTCILRMLKSEESRVGKRAESSADE